MRKRIFGYLVALTVALFVSGGCAKKEIVKSEQPVAPVQTAPQVTPEQAKPAPSESRPEPLKQEPMAETPAIQQEAPKTAPQQGGESLQNELQKIYFNFDSANLSDDARSSLSKNADMLAKNPSVKLRIEGNCDERGSDDYNMALGERRAKAARDYLVNLGVQPDRLSVISYGEEKPVDPGHDDAAWAKNRRDEFVIVK
jgi:peptidoglycan-associated lipoprotein